MLPLPGPGFGFQQPYGCSEQSVTLASGNLMLSSCLFGGGGEEILAHTKFLKCTQRYIQFSDGISICVSRLKIPKLPNLLT